MPKSAPCAFCDRDTQAILTAVESALRRNDSNRTRFVSQIDEFYQRDAAIWDTLATRLRELGLGKVAKEVVKKCKVQGVHA